MDILVLALIVLAVVSVGGWGYGTYGRRAAVGGDPVVAGPGYANPLGILGLVLIVIVALSLFNGWRPVGPAW